jgi:hypothetical protein
MTPNNRHGRRWQAGLAAALFVAASPAPSRAAGDEAGARVLFAEGRRLVDAGDYAQACPKFEDSFRLDPGIGTNFNLADCLEHVGRPASAWSRFLDVAAATKAAGQVERERVARARATALEPKLAHLVVAVTAPVPGLVVERDGVPVGMSSLGIPVPVDPGDHLIEATAPGKKLWSTTATVPDGPMTVAISVAALEDLPPEVSAPSAAAVAPGPSLLVSHAEAPRRVPTSAIVLGAAGAAALATGAVFAFEFQSANSEAKALCPGGVCRTLDEKTHHDTLVSDARLDRVLGFVSAGVGGAALLTAGYLWWRAARARSAGTPVVSFAFAPAAGSVDVMLAARAEIAW